MAVHRILCYGEPLLEAENAPVEDFGPELEALVGDLLDTCRAAPGLGLAAPQIGVNLRLAVVDLPALGEADEPLVLANPELLAGDGRVTADEGCLSFPSLYVALARPRRVTVRHQDVHGEWHDLEAEDLLARALCHELDHLDAVLLVHHLQGLKRRVFLRRVEKMRRSGVWPAPPPSFPPTR